MSLSDVTYGNVPHSVVSIICAVLTERRESDAVVEGQATELEWFEQLGNALGLLGDESSTGGRILSRREVWDARRCLVDVMRLFFNVRLDSVVGRHVGRSRWPVLAVVGAVLIYAAQLGERNKMSQMSSIVLFRNWVVMWQGCLSWLQRKVQWTIYVSEVKLSKSEV